ncbi:MAG: tetratricopeptide repeat protein [Pseudanabaenaceae cyanobacterium]
MDWENLTTEELLAQLHNEEIEIRELATAELWRRWFFQKGMIGFLELQRSQTLLDQGQPELAEAVLSQLIEHLPDFAEAWNRRAVLHYHQQDYVKSLRDCEQVVKLVPYHFGAWHGMGLCYIGLGQYRPAIRALQKALEIQPHGIANQRLILECMALLS